MSILIKGMEMPKNGELKIHFATSPNGLTITLVEDKDGNALEHNGVVEVKTPHGRLIDVEEESLLKTISLGGLSAKALWRRIKSQPTIIEAEE